MKTLLTLSMLLPFGVSGQTVLVTINATGAVTGFYASPAPTPTPANCCTQMDMSDVQIAAYLNPGPTPATLYANALAAGIAITSTAAPALNATYSTTLVAQSNVAGIAASIGAGQGPPNGASTIDWLDAAGASHTFTAEQFLTLADVIRNYVYALQITEATLAAGGTASWPTSSVTIP